MTDSDFKPPTPPVPAAPADAASATARPSADELAALATEQSNPRTADLDLLSSSEIAARVFEEDAVVHRACLAVAERVGDLADLAASALRGGGRLVYVGAGSSGRLGVLDASELPPTFGIDPARVPALIAGGRAAVFAAREGAEDDAHAGAAAVAELGVAGADCVCGISASGVTPYVVGALAEALRRGASTGAVVCGEPAPGLRPDVLIRLDTGPEVLAGSTRMKAGSATKMVLNALSLTTMVRLGKVHGNRMVDLRAGSRKLRERARRLVEELGQVGPGNAAELLIAADGSAKLAILLARTGLDAVAGRERLESVDGSLRAALEAVPDAGRSHP
jgi:N-acetylmuramic acid 6-phosphate etherase